MSSVTVNPGGIATGDPGRPLIQRKRSLSGGVAFGDRVYSSIIFLASLAVMAIIVGIGVLLYLESRRAIHTIGFSFLTGSVWDDVHAVYSAKPFILDTLYSSFLALLIAVPISVGAAIFLSEITPRLLRTPLAFLIEMLAAIPSVIYGIWGYMVLSPWTAAHIETPIWRNHHIGRFFLFSTKDAPQGSDMLAAALILSIMVTPYITSVSRDILRAIPKAARDGSYALGATQWETISRVVLPYARAGIIGAVILGLGRALGETMAVTMVIGNNNKPFSPSIFVPGNTMASAMANNFGTAITGTLEYSSIMEIGLILFVVTMVVNAGARILVSLTGRDVSGGTRK